MPSKTRSFCENLQNITSVFFRDILERDVPRDGFHAVPSFVNQGGHKSSFINPGFLDPDLMTSGHDRNRTHSQGHSQGRSPRFNNTPESSNSGSTNSGLGNPIVANSANYYATQPILRRDRSRSHDHMPGLNVIQSIPAPAFAIAGFPDPSGMILGHRYERRRAHSHSHHRSHSHDRRPQASPGRHPHFTTGSHVKPIPIPSPSPSQQFHKPVQQPQMPPPEPKHIRASSMPHAASQVFQYSRCTGRKKALCVGISSCIALHARLNCLPPKIGINYLGQRNELRGCVNDAKNVRKFLISM
jgi:hypothetical protein